MHPCGGRGQPLPETEYSLLALHRSLGGHVVPGHKAGLAGAQVVDVEPVGVGVTLPGRLHPVALAEGDVGADAALVVVQSSDDARAAAARRRPGAARPRLRRPCRCQVRGHEPGVEGQISEVRCRRTNGADIAA